MTEFIPFEYSHFRVFRRIADDIYETGEAGIREALQNSLTAVKNAQRKDYIEPEEALIQIQLKDEGRLKLTIQDNGIGISKQTLHNVIVQIGKSSNRDDGTVSGKYGMGFLALYKLAGTDGGFTMHTKSRETDEEIKGLWTDGGFKPQDELEDLSDSYGTTLQLYLKEKFDRKQVRDWVKEQSKNAGIPVRYEEYNRDGEQVIDEEYGGIDILPDHEYFDSDWVYSFTESNSFFNLYVCDNPEETNNQFYLFNSPIEYSDAEQGDFLSYLDVQLQLKNENGVIIKGPNKGLTPLPRDEYNHLDDTTGYIMEKDVHTNDIRLPKPTGTRGKLRSSPKFWQYITELVKSDIEEFVNDVLADYEPSSEIEPEERAAVAVAESVKRFQNIDYPNISWKEPEGRLINIEHTDVYGRLTKDVMVFASEYDWSNFLNDEYWKVSEEPLYKVLASNKNVLYFNKSKYDPYHKPDLVTLLEKKGYCIIAVEDDVSEFGFKHLKDVDTVISKQDVKQFSDRDWLVSYGSYGL